MSSKLREKIWLSQFIHATGHVDQAIEVLNDEKDEDNIELLLGRLEPKKRTALHRLLQILFCDLVSSGLDLDTGFKSQEDGYDELIQALQINAKRWTLVSLNYDCLFEESLKRANIPFRYDTLKFGDERDKADFVVYKPHGSINFFSHGDHRFGYGSPPSEPGEPTQLSTREDGSVSINFPITLACSVHPTDIVYRSANSLCHPVLANYAARKDCDYNEIVLNQVRKNALEKATECEELYIVGVNPIIDRADDPFCAALLELKYKKVVYVGKGNSASAQIRNIFPHAEIFENGVLDFIKSVAGEPDYGL